MGIASLRPSCELNNFSMAIELKVVPISTEKYRSTDISGDYAAMARAFGGYGERITRGGRHRACDPSRHCEDQRGHSGAVGVHHQQGDRGVAAGDVTVIAVCPSFRGARCANPESWDSPMRNCAFEIRCGARHRDALGADPAAPRNDGRDQERLH
jgi:hypothetical protein